MALRLSGAQWGPAFLEVAVTLSVAAAATAWHDSGAEQTLLVAVACWLAPAFCAEILLQGEVVQGKGAWHIRKNNQSKRARADCAEQ